MRGTQRESCFICQNLGYPFLCKKYYSRKEFFKFIMKLNLNLKLQKICEDLSSSSNQQYFRQSNTVRQQLSATIPVKHIIQSQARSKSFSQLATRIHMMSHQGAQKRGPSTIVWHSTIWNSTTAGQYIHFNQLVATKYLIFQILYLMVTDKNRLSLFQIFCKSGTNTINFMKNGCYAYNLNSLQLGKNP